MGIDGADIKKIKEKRASQPEIVKEINEPVQSMTPEKFSPVPQQIYSPPAIKIDCHACKLTGGMEKDTIKKFSGLLLVIGFIIAIPSAIGMAIAVFGLIGAVLVDVKNAGNTAATPIAIFISLFIFCTSLIGGGIGWFLLSSKKVFRCTRCGYVIDRA
jgi:hypothetical protein